MLTAEVIHILYNKLAQNCHNDQYSDCLLYTRYTQNGYGVVRKCIDGHTFRLYAHRVALLYATSMTALPDGRQCSHLCHKKLCVNIAHLSVEPQSVNNNRNQCKNERVCSRNHVDSDGSFLPDCIFH